jgi:hypothetical protein
LSLSLPITKIRDNAAAGGCKAFILSIIKTMELNKNIKYQIYILLEVATDKQHYITLSPKFPKTF